MYKKNIQILTVIAGILFQCTAFAQTKDFKPVTDIVSFKKKFAGELKKIKTIQSTFIQEKNLAMLEEKIVSEGKFWFEASDKVRIEYEKPFHYLMIINGSKVTTRDDQKETHTDANSNKLFRQVNDILVDCVRGTILDNKDFKYQVLENDKNYLLLMTPVSKTLQRFFKTIELTVDKSDATVATVNLIEPDGDNTLMKFANKKLNEQLDGQVFIR